MNVEISTDRTSEILKSLTTNRWILIALLVILILFVLLTIGFVYLPMYNMQKQVTSINDESKQALNILTTTAADVETTLTGLNSAAVQANKLEDTIFAFIGGACKVVLFSGSDFCKNYA